MPEGVDLALVPDEVSGGTLAAPRLVTPALLRQWPLPEPSGTKYSRGQVLVIGGARQTPGAAMLAGEAALRMGAGRLSLGVAESVASTVAVAMPECGATGLPEDDEGSVEGSGVGRLLAKELGRCDALVIGPGLDEPEGTLQLMGEVLCELPDHVPVVLDAFAATILPDLDEEVRSSLRGRVALTPNTGELAHLLEEDSVDEHDLAQGVATAAERFGAAVACNSWVVWDGGVWQLTTGDTGLGTSGSGDVVAGAVGGVLSRGAGLVQAVIWAKYVHAASGDTLAARFGRVGYLASEIGPELPRVMRTLGGD